MTITNTGSFRQQRKLFYILKQILTQAYGEAEEGDDDKSSDDDDAVTFKVDLGKYK